MAVEYKPNLAETVERMRRLWNLEEPVDRVPVSIHVPVKSRLRPKADGSFYGRLDDYLEHREDVFRAHAGVMDEWMPIVHPQFGHALISALCGSPIRAAAETVWSVPIIEDLSQAEGLHLDWENEHGRRAREDYERLLDWARGRCFAATYEVEGVADTMAALRGTERLCTDYYDRPEATRRFACRVTDALIEFGRWSNRNIAERQEILGGVADPWSIWMPRNSICFTEDASVMYSPDLYRRFIRPHDRRLASAFNRNLLEVHAESNHLIPDFGDIPGLWMMAIQNPLKMRPRERESVKRLLGRKIFMTGAAPDQLEDLLRFTGTRGIYVTTSVDDAGQARKVLDELERVTAACRSQE